LKLICTTCKSERPFEGEAVEAPELRRAQGLMFLVWCGNPECGDYEKKMLVEVFRYYGENERRA